MIVNTHPTATIPTRQDLLKDFVKWGSDRFQFERLQRRWQNCGYSLHELTFLVEAA